MFEGQRTITISQDMIETLLICLQYMRADLLAGKGESLYNPQNLQDTEEAIKFFEPLSILP